MIKDAYGTNPCIRLEVHKRGNERTIDSYAGLWVGVGGGGGGGE